MKLVPDHGSCFVCGKDNDNGIGIEWFYREDKAIWGSITLTLSHQGPPNMAHGGATAALLDDAMGTAVWVGGNMVASVNMNVNYLKPVPLGETIEISAHVVRKTEKAIHTQGEIKLPDGSVAVVSKGIYVEAPHLFEGIDDQINGSSR